MFLILLVGNNLLISCEGLVKYGIVVFVDFNKINCLCNCIVILLFDGILFVILWGLFL